MWRSLDLLALLAAVPAGCSLGGGSAAPAGPAASPAKLRILQQTFARPPLYGRVESIADAEKEAPIAAVRPDAALASDSSIASVWVGSSGAGDKTDVAVFWRSGVVETFERWTCNCVAAPGMRQMGHTKPFRFLMLRGAPAITAPSAPSSKGAIGLVAPADAAYGVPASVDTIRDGYRITLWEYGAHTQAGLLAVAQTLPVDHTPFQLYGYEAGGPALGNWNGKHGIDVAQLGGAQFGVGVALRNVSGQPLTITGVDAINGFIRLIGVHLRPYTPPTGSSIGPEIAQAPYTATPPQLDYRLKPNAWVGMQLDYRVENPCTSWAQTFYDVTVEVHYTEDGAGHIADVPMVRLNIGRPKPCKASA